MCSGQSIEQSVLNALSKGLASALGNDYEPRGGQPEMALDISRGFSEDRILIIEAGTGLGKSLAYLLPILIHCNETGGRAVVSTHTRTLQRQLIEKDFPQAVRATGLDLEAATLLGRQNYACKQAIRRLLEKGGLDGETEEWLRWVFDDDRGELENLLAEIAVDPAIRRGVSCPSGDAACTGCRFRDECHLFRARRRALASQLVFSNHALLFSDLSTSGALLGSYDLLVIDEAHRLPEVATRFLTLSFSPRSIRGSPHSLYTGALEDVVSYARAIVAKEHAEAGEDIDKLWKSFHASLGTTHRAAERLFEQLNDEIQRLLPSRKHSAETSHSNSGLRYFEDSPLLLSVETEIAQVKQGFSRMVSAAEPLSHIVSENPILFEAGAAGGLRALSEAVREAGERFGFIVSGADESYVFYAETSAGGLTTALSASPIDVSPQLGALLEENCRSVLLTSATLAVGGDFTYTLKELGISGSSRTRTSQYNSPFDMGRQRSVFLASFLPEPNAPGYPEKAAVVIGRVAELLPRKMLVLCTSRSQLRQVQKHLSKCSTLSSRVLAQEENASRSELIERFKAGRGARVLLGLASFWEGVDFPGEFLEVVVVVKMPFLVPTEPVSQAKAQKLRESGEDPFWEFILPDAILKLRQGIGRLIRTGSDRGAVIVLDARLRDRTYGDFVLEAVSDRVIHNDCLEDLLEGVRAVFLHDRGE
ncbi:MAG: DEAD/DEAH box helicase [Candidatus Latescibacteria bacterium]|nr:DEAD/DEAH box helicase [Candidatus Latescibacterota bacterium]NIM21018.1 DEAD/DEAH box helicase [Candidatus Latescibacterota bacterium]NIM65153.1 DEAD/DEAH box helicase [Candidatus Latescibacterota bacterium]NIO01668.1 DEAD/DEAH box helicase [Candidatus Latescibacterota bacterium]NIO28185.1 DEAD/DEAH box helicase [Candidatus Latescibacterota bacterium]